MTESKDPTPLGYVTLPEAFQKFRKAKRGANVDEHPPHGSAKWRKWQEPYSKALGDDEMEFFAALADGELEVVYRKLSDGQEYRITPDEIRRSFSPGQWAWADTIEDMASPLRQYQGRTPHVATAALTAWIAGLKLRHARETGFVAKKRTVSPASATAQLAISALWPDGIPATMQATERDYKIECWCKSQNPKLRPPSPKTIRNVLKAIKEKAYE